VNRTRGFINLNRFKSGRAIKQLSKAIYDRRKKKVRKRINDGSVSCISCWVLASLHFVLA